MNVQPFNLDAGNALNLNATTTSAFISLPATAAQASTVLIANNGSNPAFIRATSSQDSRQSNVASVTTDTVLLAGDSRVFCKGRADTISAITPTGTTTLNITPGEGQ